MNKQRYIYDALYGRIYLPNYVWEVLSAPEIQRLREVRLCNINSLCLTGGANINRYEHAIGTAYLAIQRLNSDPFGFSPEEARLFVLAALLHDIGSAAFGHSVQYVLETAGYEHESFYNMVTGFMGDSQPPESFTYQQLRLEGILFGLQRQLPTHFGDDELHAIGSLVQGQGPFGLLLNGTIDLDNIDNVFRLAFHIGLFQREDTPLRLAKALRVVDGALAIEEQHVSLISKWYETRRILYEYLLLNPDEFSAKAMLQEAIEHARQETEFAFRWTDVDFELLQKLSRTTFEAKSIVARLVVGDLYGCFGLFASAALDKYAELQRAEVRAELELHLQKVLRRAGGPTFRQSLVRIHVILDHNKTQRRVAVSIIGGGEVVVGRPTRRLLVGVFLKNQDLSMTQLDPVTAAKRELREGVVETLQEFLGDPDVSEIEQYAEGCE